MFVDLLNAFCRINQPTILLVGDFMLDRYVYGDALRISPEAPVQVLKVVRREQRCGGAASVAADIQALNAKTICVGVVGQDAAGDDLLALLNDCGAATDGIMRLSDRPTTCKERIIGLAQHRHRQQLLRIDDETAAPLPEQVYQRLLAVVERQIARCDAVCLQDYNKGMLAERFCQQIIALANRHQKKVLVDPPLGADYSKFRGAFLITPNRKEASEAAGFAIQTIDDAARAAAALRQRFELTAAAVTLDKEGVYYCDGAASEHLPTIPRLVYDVTGAGDMMLAMTAVALGGGLDLRTALRLANIAGGLEVEKFGVATVSRDEMIAELIRRRGAAGKVRDLRTLQHELACHRQQNQTIVFTNGCFDVLHRGHVEYLNFCKKQGDIVIVGLNSDASVRQIKGPTRPINNQDDRAAVLAALESVDYVVIFDEPDPLNTIMAVRPDVLVKGADWATKGVIGREFVESYGGRVELAALVEGKSSTSIIEKMAAAEKKDA